jgi:hypothetical protein
VTRRWLRTSPYRVTSGVTIQAGRYMGSSQSYFMVSIVYDYNDLASKTAPALPIFRGEELANSHPVSNGVGCRSMDHAASRKLGNQGQEGVETSIFRDLHSGATGKAALDQNPPPMRSGAERPRGSCAMLLHLLTPPAVIETVITSRCTHTSRTISLEAFCREARDMGMVTIF